MPPLEAIAQEVIAGVRQRPAHSLTPEMMRVLTPAEKAEADKVEQRRLYCHLCAGTHAMPGTAGCPRLASFTLDGEGRVTGGTFWPGLKWSKGRVKFIEDLMESADDG